MRYYCRGFCRSFKVLFLNSSSSIRLLQYLFHAYNFLSKKKDIALMFIFIFIMKSTILQNTCQVYYRLTIFYYIAGYEATNSTHPFSGSAPHATTTQSSLVFVSISLPFVQVFSPVGWSYPQKDLLKNTQTKSHNINEWCEWITTKRRGYLYKSGDI